MRPVRFLSFFAGLLWLGQAWAQGQAPCPSHTDRARGQELRLTRPSGEQTCRLLELQGIAGAKRIARHELPAGPLEYGLSLGPARAGKVLLAARHDFWVYDLVERSLAGPFRPCVPEGADAQSGNLKGLTWLADQLVAGQAVDRGRFVFGLDGKARELVPTGTWSAQGPTGLDCPEGVCLSLFTDPSSGRMLGLLDDRLAFRDRRLRPAKVLVGDELGGCQPRRPVPAPATEEVFDAADRLRGLVLTDLGHKTRRRLVFDPVAGKLLTLTGTTPVASQLAQQAAGVAMRLWQGRRYAKAADAYGLALDLVPENPAWRLQRAAVQTLASQADDAVHSLAAAARQDLLATRKVLRNQRAFAGVIGRPEVRALLTSDQPVYPAPAALAGPSGELSIHPIGWSADGKFAWAEWRPATPGKAGGELALRVLDTDEGQHLLNLVLPVPPGEQGGQAFKQAWEALTPQLVKELADRRIVPAVGVELRSLPARTALGTYLAYFQATPEGKTALISQAPADKPRTHATETLASGARPEAPGYLKNPFGDQRLLLAMIPLAGDGGRPSLRIVIDPI